MAGGLGVMLATHDPRVVPAIFLGAALSFISMLLFLVIVLKDTARMGLRGLASAPSRSFGW